MYSRQPLKISLETGAEGRIKGVAGAPECISAGFWAREHLERRRNRRLQLVRHICVPELGQ